MLSNFEVAAEWFLAKMGRGGGDGGLFSNDHDGTPGTGGSGLFEAATESELRSLRPSITTLSAQVGARVCVHLRLWVVRLRVLLCARVCVCVCVFSRR